MTEDADLQVAAGNVAVAGDVEDAPGQGLRQVAQPGAGSSKESIQRQLAGRRRTGPAVRARRRNHMNCGRWESRLAVANCGTRRSKTVTTGRLFCSVLRLRDGRIAGVGIPVRHGVPGAQLRAGVAHEGLGGAGRSEPTKAVDEDMMTGVDLEVADIATEISGRKAGNPRFVKCAALSRRCKQRDLSRKGKGSTNCSKVCACCQGAERTANARHDFQRKLSERLTDEDRGGICGDAESQEHAQEPDACRAHRGRGAGRAWCASRRAGPNGGQALGEGGSRWIPSSKTYTGCGTKIQELTLSVRRWTCRACGRELD